MEIPGQVLRPKIVGVPLVSRLFARTDSEAAAGPIRGLQPRLISRRGWRNMPFRSLCVPAPAPPPSPPQGLGGGAALSLLLLLLLAAGGWWCVGKREGIENVYVIARTLGVCGSAVGGNSAERQPITTVCGSGRALATTTLCQYRWSVQSIFAASR